MEVWYALLAPSDAFAGRGLLMELGFVYQRSKDDISIIVEIISQPRICS